jgi:hypothetical protein
MSTDKYFMNDAFTNAFFGIVREAQENTGYELPVHLEHYVVMVLAIHIDKPNWHPEQSFAEAYLKLKSRRNAKELGDTCLFVSGVFPTFGSNKGLSRSYFQNIGKTSYSQVTGELFSDLSLHFDFLSDFIDVAIHTPGIINLQSRKDY